MTEDQIATIKCAFADLQGAYQAYKQLDMHAHDWKAHMLTLEEMAEQFDFLDALEVDE
jgi:uncharacterized protein YbaP (TraB family)